MPELTAQEKLLIRKARASKATRKKRPLSYLRSINGLLKSPDRPQLTPTKGTGSVRG